MIRHSVKIKAIKEYVQKDSYFCKNFTYVYIHRPLIERYTERH